MKTLPYLLFEANVSLYPADATGQALTGAAVWLGACASGARLTDRLEGLRLGNSGDRFKQVVHVDESHEISFERLWVVQKTEPSVFAPGRNQQYVLEIIWTDRGTWYKRTYYGVTGEMVELASRGVLQFNQTQTFQAQYFQEAGGYVAPRVRAASTGGGTSVGGGGVLPPGTIFTPIGPTSEEQPVAFFHENALQVGTYLLGLYRWSATVTVRSAKVLASAPQNVATVLTLEVDGVLTAHTLTIPVDDPNESVEGSATFTLTIAAGSTVRWKVTSGPDNGVDAAWQVAVVMMVQL